MLDVGCGPAGMVEYAKAKGLQAVGVDGDPKLFPNDNIVMHDFYQGPFHHGQFDLIWSVEFLEHVAEEYLPHVMETFRQGRMVVCTHALPHELGGHNHVNCRTEKYWIAKFEEYGFRYNLAMTKDTDIPTRLGKPRWCATQWAIPERFTPILSITNYGLKKFDTFRRASEYHAR